MQARRVIVTADMDGWWPVPAGMMYVAVSRVAHRQGLYVHNGTLAPAMFQADRRVEAEYARLRELQAATLAKGAAYRTRREEVVGEDVAIDME